MRLAHAQRTHIRETPSSGDEKGPRWLGGNVCVSGTEDREFESRKGVRFLGLYTYITMAQFVTCIVTLYFSEICKRQFFCLKSMLQN
jgi:hypothetical protein